jgi:hypothetical protein
MALVAGFASRLLLAWSLHAVREQWGHLVPADKILRAWVQGAEFRELLVYPFR